MHGDVGRAGEVCTAVLFLVGTAGRSAWPASPKLAPALLLATCGLWSQKPIFCVMQRINEKKNITKIKRQLPWPKGLFLSIWLKNHLGNEFEKLWRRFYISQREEH